MEYLHTEKGVLCKGNRPFLLRGMGLSGWLLPEGYMWKFYTKCDRPRRMEALIEELCGPAYASSFWERFNRTFITEKDIRWIAEQGLNSVRLALNARHLFETDAGGSVRFCQETLSHVDDALAWCKKYGLYLFLDMHGAPGGQTGQNIDDSERDIPELFTNPENQDILVKMWQLLALHYAGEPAVGGYDLLNEPLPKWNKQYNSQLLPLYRRLIAAIRSIDKKHVIVLEGCHWATDFSVFDEFTPEEGADNILLQFHKYWNDPDEESLAEFVKAAKRLQAPLWMGEGGENNLSWYTYAFPMYERLGIGWCFWSYKKMEVPNSPVTFPQPAGWGRILAYLDGGERPDSVSSQEIFDDFLKCIAQGTYHPEVIHALLRKPDVLIPAAAFDREKIISRRTPGVHFRMRSSATLLFADGHAGQGDWRRYGGEPQPEEQRILLCLRAGDAVGYRIESQGRPFDVQVLSYGTGKRTLKADLREGILWLTCTEGSLQVESLLITEKK